MQIKPWKTCVDFDPTYFNIMVKYYLLLMAPNTIKISLFTQEHNVSNDTEL